MATKIVSKALEYYTYAMTVVLGIEIAFVIVLHNC